MTWFRCSGGNGGGPNPVTYKNYIKFNGEGIWLPISIDSDHKVEVVFNETSYNNDSSIIGNTQSASLIHLTAYSNKYYCSKGRSEGNFGSWSSGEHKFVCNNGNGHNEFDDVEVTEYTPTTDGQKYTLGSRGDSTGRNAYYGYIKSFKIYSIANGTLLHDLKPAVIFSQACFLDDVTGQIYTNNTIEAVDVIT